MSKINLFAPYYKSTYKRHDNIRTFIRGELNELFAVDCNNREKHTHDRKICCKKCVVELSQF